MPQGPPPRRPNAAIPDAICPRDRAPIESACCQRVNTGARCPVGTCRHCGATWRRVDQLPLMAAGAGTRDLEAAPSMTTLRDRSTR